MKVNVIRLESSGGNWICSILAMHPEISVSEYSFPRFMGAEREYPDVPQCDVLCVPCRDSTIQEMSVDRHGYNSLTTDSFSREESVEKMNAAIRSHSDAGARVVFISYETLIQYRDLYLSSVFQQIGVSVEDFQYDLVEYRDGNVKYIK